MKNFKNIYTPFSYCALTKLKRFYLYEELFVVTGNCNLSGLQYYLLFRLLNIISELIMKLVTILFPWLTF